MIQAMGLFTLLVPVFVYRLYIQEWSFEEQNTQVYDLVL